MRSSASPSQLYHFAGASALSRSPSSASNSASSPSSSRPSSSSGPRRSSASSNMKPVQPKSKAISTPEQSCKSTCLCTKCTLGDFVFESEADYLDYLEIVSQLGPLPSSVSDHSKLHHTHDSDLTSSPASSPELPLDLPSPSTSSTSSASVSPKLPAMTPLPSVAPLLLPSHLDRLPKLLNAQRAEQLRR